MDINARKLDLINWLSAIQDNKVIEVLEKLKNEFSTKEEWWDTLPLERKQLIQKAREEAHTGKTKPHAQVMAKYRAKYKR